MQNIGCFKIKTFIILVVKEFLKQSEKLFNLLNYQS